MVLLDVEVELLVLFFQLGIHLVIELNEHLLVVELLLRIEGLLLQIRNVALNLLDVIRYQVRVLQLKVPGFFEDTQKI